MGRVFKGLLFLTFVIQACALAITRAELEEDLQNRALLYFLENSNPETGLVRVVAENFRPTPINKMSERASIAATGFGLAVIANASERRLVATFDDGSRQEITPEFAIDYSRKVLRAVTQRIQTHRGWLPHYVHWKNGARFDKTEYSTIDTALFLAGALYAAQIYPELQPMVEPLYLAVDYQDMLKDGGAAASKNKKTLTLSYKPEENPAYSRYQWRLYAEHMILLFLGLTHPSHPMDVDTWTAWERESITLPSGEKLIGYDKPIFTHQYSHLFIDFRKFKDAYANYFDNAVLATRYNREVCLGDKKYETFRKGFWGLSAGDSPHGYKAFSPLHHEGTVCPACAGASVQFDPDLVWPDLQKWRNFKLAAPDNRPIFGRYGFADGIDLDANWIAPEVHAITVGPLFLAIANQRESTSVWRHFMQLPRLKEAIDAAAHAVPHS